jgi:hypothetical protein
VVRNNNEILKTLINLEPEKYWILRIAGPRIFINILGSGDVFEDSGLLAIVRYG